MRQLPLDSLGDLKYLSATTKLCDQLFISLISTENSTLSTNICGVDHNQYASISTDIEWTCLTPSSLGHLYSFHRDIENAIIDSTDSDLVVLVRANRNQIALATYLLGGYMILGRGMSADEVAAIFMPIYGVTECAQSDFQMQDYWRALHHAKSLGWVNFQTANYSDDNDEEPAFIDMEEYLHYDDTANGAMHLVDPARLLLFRCPADLPAGQAWRDEGGRRVFGAEHYAGVFGDFDVRLVVRCGGARGGWDSGALRAAGMAVEELRVAPGGGAGVMAAVDRFLTLMRAAPGCIAVQCGGGNEEGSCGGSNQWGRGWRMGEEAAARLLVAAHLIRHRGFGAAEALAWVRMAHPAAAAGPAPALVLLRGGRGQ
jgi:hypothetical protein